MDYRLLLENPALASSVRIEITGKDLVSLASAVTNALKSPPPTTDETFLTQAEVIELVRRDRTTLSRWHSKGVLTHNSLGLYRKSEVLNLLSK